MQQPELIALLQKYHLRPDKKLGQHYLLSEEILQKIIETAEIKPDELIFEIGGGPGILTKKLAESGADVLTVEFDRDFCRLLQEEYHNWRNVHVLCDYALRIDLSKLQKDGQPYRKIVANIPYQITNPLVRRILEPTSPITTAVLLIQKEVAERLTAPAGSSERGILTIMAEAFGLIEKVADVPAQAFWPAPKVESAVIKITKYAEPKIEPERAKVFFWIVKQGFSGKRKTIVNSLSGGLQLSKEKTTGIVEEAGIDTTCRAEDLTLTQWQALVDVIVRALDS